MPNKDPLFPDSDPLATSLLSRAYEAQVRFFYPRELSVFRSCERWRRAQSILDVGTGNGCFVQRLALDFPEKQYTAIDIDHAQIAIAKATNLTGVSFLVGEAKQTHGRYDAVLLRFVAQHLPDLSSVLRQLSGVLGESGTIYITEGDERLAQFDPSPEAFRQMFRVLAAQRQSIGADFDIVEHMDGVAGASGLRLLEVREARATTTDCGGLQGMWDMQAAILAYLKHLNVVPYDYEGAGRDLLQWFSTHRCYGQEGLKMFKFGRS